MQYSKNCKIGMQWQSMSLTPEEVKKLEKDLRGRNQELMALCLNDAKGLLNVKGSTIEVIEVAVGLFVKLTDAKYTMIQATLDGKIQGLKDEYTAERKRLEAE